MEESEIREEFTKAINTRGLGIKLGYNKRQVWAYKNNEVTLGTMLEFLWRLDKIDWK